MAVQIKDTAADTVEGSVMSTDLVTGAAVTVAENVTRAVNHPVREARKIERRGAAVNKRIGSRLEDLIEDTSERVEAMMPERVALLGIHAIKDRARRKDLVGDVAYRTLEIVNGGLEAVLGTLNRLERATAPPARPGTTHTRPPRPVKKAAQRVKRSAATAARATRNTVRRGTARARQTERKSA